MIGVQVGDPERELVTILKAALGPGIASPDYPSETLAEGARAVQVDFEGSDDSDYPIVERAHVRIVCHRPPGDRTAVKDDADDVRRTLVTFGGSAAVSGIFPAGGRSAVSTDPDTGNLMCWFLVRVDLKATPAP